MSGPKVPINPGVSVLGVFKHLNYREWYAIAEFVDNSIQSFLQNREELRNIGSETLKVTIDIQDDGTITVSDSAAGIPLSEFPRAFRPAHAPEDASGLSEFGMGMKSAACWFAPRWNVRTKALGETVEREVSFDVRTIVDLGVDEIQSLERPAEINAHYTVVELLNANRVPRKKTLTKIREHLSDIYRKFLREGWLTIELKGVELAYQEPVVLHQPPDWDKTAEPTLWRKEIDFDFGVGKRVYGFAALFATAATKRAGFALFRRNRLIQGSGDEGYKPATIFGSANSFRRQRLFGELTLEGFDVAHTKDGFQWDEDEEEAFLDLLKEHLAADPVRLLKQADDYRARKSKSALEAVTKKAAQETVRDAEKGLIEASSDGTTGDKPDDEPEPSPQNSLTDESVFVTIDGRHWEVHVQPTLDPSEQDWVKVVDSELLDGTRKLIIRVSVDHPFSVRFIDDDERSWQAMMRAAAAVAIGQALAKGSDPKAAVGAAATVRGINKALKGIAK